MAASCSEGWSELIGKRMELKAMIGELGKSPKKASISLSICRGETNTAEGIKFQILVVTHTQDVYVQKTRSVFFFKYIVNLY